MSQISFFVTKSDEENLLTYIRSRNAYLARDIPKRGVTEVVHANSFEADPPTTLHILEGNVFPSENLNSPKWRIRVKRGIFSWESQFIGPSIAYQVYDHGYDQISCARLWCQYSSLSFHGAGPWKDGPPYNVSDLYAGEVRAFDRLYNNIANFIRRNYRRNNDAPGAFWHGPDSDRLEAEGVLKAQFVSSKIR